MPRYGWKRDRPDARDFKFSIMRPTLLVLPPAASVEALEPPIWDQGELGSCTGHGTCRVVQMARRKEGLPDIALSRLMAYYVGRELERTTALDEGAEIRDVIKGVARSGVCAETDWPYDVARFAEAPPSDAWTAALADCIKGYSKLDNSDLASLKRCIAGGDPFVFGFDVPEAFEGNEIATTGQMSGAAWDGRGVGGHCVVAVAYDDGRQAFLIANSWGSGWGDPAHPGHFWMPFSFVTSSACSDFWHVSTTGYGPSPQN